MAGGQDQKSNLYSRLTRGRSKPNLKTGTPGRDGSSLGSVPTTPTLSLPKGFGKDDVHDLQGEDDISKFMFSDLKGGPDKSKDVRPGAQESHSRSYTTDSISRTYDIAEFTARRSVETTTVAELQTRLLQEMKEKGELMSRYETLSSQHLSLQKEITTARNRAGSTSTVTANGPIAAASAGAVETTKLNADGTPSAATVTVDASESSIRGDAFAPSIATSTHSAAYAADDVFREEMARCAASLQSWVVSGWSNKELDFEKAAGRTRETDAPGQSGHKPTNGTETISDGATSALDKNSRRDVLAEVANIAGPDFKNIATRSKLPFLQALVAARLMEIFDDDFFFGLPSLDDGTDLAALRQSYRVLRASASDGATAPDVNAWRAHTALLLRNLAEHSAELRTHTEQLVFGLSSSIDALLVSVTSAEPSAPRREQLRGIVARVVELSRLFRAQLAEFAFALPNRTTGETLFDKERMTNGGEASLISVVRNVELATWPAVLRLSESTTAGKPTTNTVVCKAQVVLAENS